MSFIDTVSIFFWSLVLKIVSYFADASFIFLIDDQTLVGSSNTSAGFSFDARFKSFIFLKVMSFVRLGTTPSSIVFELWAELSIFRFVFSDTKSLFVGVK